MASWGSYSYVYGPLVALCGIAVFAGLLRWAFSRGGSVVERPVTPGSPDAYGLLTAIAEPETFIEGEIARQTLQAEGIRATLAMTQAGPRLMVWPSDEDVARDVLARR